MSSFFDDNDPLRDYGAEPEKEPAAPVTTEVAADEDVDEAANEPKTHRDQQRGALQELVDLAADCANREKEIEGKVLSASSETSGIGQKQRTGAERKYKSLQEQIAAKVQERQNQIQARYQQTATTLKTHDQHIKSKVKADLDAIQQQVKKDYDQAVWLSESVLEAAEAKITEELKKATELNVAQAEALTQKENETGALMTRYGQAPPPSESLAVLKDAEASVDPTASFKKHMETIQVQIAAMANLSVPRLLVGGTPYLVGVVLLLIAAAIPQILAPNHFDPQWPQIGIWAGGTLVLLIVVIVLLRSIAKKQVAEAYRPLRKALDSAKIANENLLSQASMNHDVELAKAKRQQQAEAQNARDRANPLMKKANEKKDAALKANQTELATKTAENETLRKNSLAELEQWRLRKSEEVKKLYEAETGKAGSSETAAHAELRRSYDTDRGALEKRWADGLHRIQAPFQDNGHAYPAWNDPNWATWKGPTKFPETIRFGQLQVDLKTIIADVAKDAPFTLPIPGTFNVPALLAYPKQASMLIHTDRAGRADSVRALQMIMTRLLTTIPPGRVRFTMLDPVGLGQNFAGFMHLGDYDEALVGGKIWTDQDQIDQRLANLTEHMETVIQKYLRNEFATIDDYNVQAGELAEPYRYLVISDFPVNFSDEALKRLSSIASTGSRCGVYTLVMRDTRINAAGGAMHLDDLESHSVNLVREGDRFVWRDPVFNRFPLTLDQAPTDEELGPIVHAVGKQAREAKRVEVAFDVIAPKPPQFWTLKSDGDVNVAVGRCGATRVQAFRLGKGVAQHALIAGKTGSGKSTLLHALISNLAMWYSPEEVELYLIDFKKGVEFKTYAMHQLPHARAIAVESDREFGLSVLQRIDVEMGRRAELFRPYKAQNLQMYRETAKKKMPRTLLIIDEFQEFFSEDDKLAQDAALLLDRVVRQGRAFGVHLLLGSQTIGGSSGLSRSTIGQIAVRVALQTSEADSQMILGDGNSAARLLSRPGEAIYNDANGAVEGNSPFQVAWLPDEQRDKYLDQVNAKAAKDHLAIVPPIVFEGNEPADFRKSAPLLESLEASKYVVSNAAPTVYLGDPVAIKAPTSIPFRRQSGSNVLIIGQAEESAMAITAISMISVASQVAPSGLSFYLLDGTPTDAPMHGYLTSVAAALPHQTKVVDYRAVPEAIHELAEELKKRQSSEGSNPPAIFVIVFGLQRYRSLRKSEESFGFSGGDEEKPPDPGKEFADIMRDGPANGIHIIGWIDTATALDRAVDRGSMRELDHRVLYQMSATDSSNLIDSPVANKLGANRALSFSEEQGSIEKFRPYALPTAQWLAEIKPRLAAKAAVGS